MGLDELHLRVLATSSDDPREKSNAQKGACVVSLVRAPHSTPHHLVLRLMQKGRHWVLVVSWFSNPRRGIVVMVSL